MEREMLVFVQALPIAVDGRRMNEIYRTEHLNAARLAYESVPVLPRTKFVAKLHGRSSRVISQTLLHTDA